jgi:hypothetical protein
MSRPIGRTSRSIDACGSRFYLQCLWRLAARTAEGDDDRRTRLEVAFDQDGSWLFLVDGSLQGLMVGRFQRGGGVAIVRSHTGSVQT